MKLITNGGEYSVKSPRGKTGEWFSLVLLDEGRPELPIEGELRVESDGGSVLCIIETEDFARQLIRGDVLTLTNEPEPEPEPIPEPEPTEPDPDPDEDRDEMLVDLEYRITLLELGVTE